MGKGPGDSSEPLHFGGHGRLVETEDGTFWFTRHALDQMKVRGLTQGDVLSTLKNPDLDIGHPQPHRKRLRCYRGSKQAIDIIIEPRDDRTIIVTAMKRLLKSHERPDQP